MAYFIIATCSCESDAGCRTCGGSGQAIVLPRGLMMRGFSAEAPDGLIVSIPPIAVRKTKTEGSGVFRKDAAGIHQLKAANG